ncbi:hypothetical protein B5F83_08855 [Muribaculum sp. An289]|nr:hypothetical protein B5F83_08855 [Muribaculum sp. An289]OUO41957.1 hypothetical protein B5F81_08625 [Muribaculum sp. An287]
MIINNLQKTGWIWVLHDIPKRRSNFTNLLIISYLLNDWMDMGLKIVKRNAVFRNEYGAATIAI